MEENFIKDYIDYASEFCDAPNIFHKFCAYSAISAAISNHIYFEFGDLKIFPNLWIVLMAPSSLYHKSTAVGISRRLTHAANLNVSLPNEFTHEGLIDAMAIQSQGIFYFDEFMSLITALEKDYMLGAKAFLAHIFDCPAAYTRKLRGKDYEIKDPCVSILAATTLDWFQERLKERDLYGGFLTRFIFVPFNEKKDRVLTFAPPVNPDKRNHLAFMLEQISRLHGIIKFPPETMRIHDQWYEDIFINGCEKVSSLLGAFLNRLQIYLLKLSVIEELAGSLPTSPVIYVSEAAMKRATTSANFLRTSLGKMCGEELTFDKYQERRKKILKIINDSNHAVSKSELLTTTRIPVRELNEIISSLIEEEKIKELQDQTDAGLGRRKTKYCKSEMQL